MTVTDIERGLIARYVARVMERDDLPLRANRQLMYWLNDRAETLNLPVPKALERTIGNIYASGFSPVEFERAYRQSRSKIIAGLNLAAEETPPPDPLAANIRMLVKGLCLPDAAATIVGLVAVYTRYDQVQYLADSMTECVGPMTRVVSLMTNVPLRNTEELLSPTGELVASGLLQLEDGDEISGSTGRYIIPPRVDSCLDRSFDNFAEMRQSMLGSPQNAAIRISDYDHMSADRDLIAGVLAGAARTNARGVNILLYGTPGTGKTELTRVVAKKAGVSLYAAGEMVSADGESDRSARLADLVFSLRLLSETKKVALLFDEMEDVAWQLMRRGGSKVYLNRLLENNPVPVLWTSNNIHEIDPALLRRMTLAVELRMPPASQRARILGRLAKRIKVKMTESEVERLARQIEATPAVVENALKAAKLAGGGADEVERAAQGIVRAVTGATVPKASPVPDFDPKLLCASIDLESLAERLVRGQSSAFSLCLSGPPGTGKSAYARYLARALGLEILQKRASDLLGAFVGESEKRIAEAFSEAREAGAFLIFDEADSLLFDRSQAMRSWEITQVNEMLTWMEDHPLPVCFTTNLMDRMDTASLRRFTFHVRFDYLDKSAIRAAFDIFFGIKTVPADALALANLTPGDFAQARKQASVLGTAQKPDQIVELLTDIARAKPGAKGSIGFRP